MATHEIEEPSESLKHKTWFLKVPIHCACEGCKKKVRRILYKVQGVHTVDIDIKRQKVTVIGDVNSDVLIKRLAKHGKEAKLLPESNDGKDKNPGKVKNRDKQSNPESTKPTAGDIDVKPPIKVVEVEESTKKDGEGNGGGDPKDPVAAGEITGGGAAVKETKSEGKKPITVSAGNHPAPVPAVEKSGAYNVSTESDIDVEKKKTKGQKGKSINGAPSSVAAPASAGSPNNSSGPPPANHSPPRHQGYQYHQPPHFTAPPPVYAVSYNTTQPSSSNTASYYTQPPPYSYVYSHFDPMAQAPPQSHAYSYPHQVAQAPSLDYDSYPRQSLDSFEIISDENPNGCLIM